MVQRRITGSTKKVVSKSSSSLGGSSVMNLLVVGVYLFVVIRMRTINDDWWVVGRAHDDGFCYLYKNTSDTLTLSEDIELEMTNLQLVGYTGM